MFSWITALATLFVVVASLLYGASANCMLSMKLDLTYNQPLILSTVTESWYSLDSTPAGSLQLRRDETVKLVCPTHPATPNSFANFPSKNEIVAKCHHGTKFEINGKTYTFDQLQCSGTVKPTARRTGRSCLSPQNELISVGYPFGNSFVSAYEVCFDKDNKATIYTESEVSPNYNKNDAPVREGAWVNDADITGSSNLEIEYTCSGQAETFHRILGKSYFSQDDKCCFAKAQLVSSGDMAYATQQLATYHYINSVPQWSTCNNRANWVEVEKRIRQLSINLRRPLRVWSGTFRAVKLRTKWLLFASDMYIHYTDKTDKSLPIPLYIWKADDMEGELYIPHPGTVLSTTRWNNLRRPLRVWSGTFRAVKLRTKWLLFASDMYIHYTDKTDKSLPIPLYIWKVVHDPQTRKSLAIVQINKPNMDLTDVDGYKLCPDNCHNVNWMNFLQRQNIGSGYIYCCDLNDFEFAFQFKSSPFPNNAGNILRDDTRTTWP